MRRVLVVAVLATAAGLGLPQSALAQIEGRIVLKFGEKTQAGNISKGLAIETHSAARVITPIDGQVIFAHGSRVIIDAGAGYRLLFDGLGAIDVKIGQRVSAGYRIGIMPMLPPPSDNPTLYLEFSRNNVPIDPAPWFKN